MYQPKHFQMSSADQMRAVMHSHPLATLITGAGESMQVNHIPMMFVDKPGSDGLLHCHVARANPLWQSLEGAPSVIAIFTGVQAYISPNWYASKKEHGKVVPTWNYEAVHVRGQAAVKDDKDWLHAFLQALTGTHESTQTKPWQVDDAPADYLASMLGAIVGIEIVITEIEGKAKLSQNQPLANRASVIDGLRALSPDSTSATDAMALRVKGSE